MNSFEDKIKKALDEIRTNLEQDGGDVKLISIKDNEVKVKLLGACHGCPFARLTLKEGIENYLREKVDKEVIVTSDDLPEFN